MPKHDAKVKGPTSYQINLHIDTDAGNCSATMLRPKRVTLKFFLGGFGDRSRKQEAKQKKRKGSESEHTLKIE